MRLIVFVLASWVTSTVHAESLWEAELRVGYGVSMSGGGNMTSTRTSPLTLAATAAIAIRDEPRLFGYGGLVAETLDRNSVGAIGGARLVSASGRLRVGGGGTYVFAPYTLWGAQATAGICARAGLRLCLDLQLTTYFAGTDLAEGQTVTQFQGVLGMVFDAL